MYDIVEHILGTHCIDLGVFKDIGDELQKTNILWGQELQEIVDWDKFKIFLEDQPSDDLRFYRDDLTNWCCQTHRMDEFVWAWTVEVEFINFELDRREVNKPNWKGTGF
jgi:hypothetical protein